MGIQSTGCQSEGYSDTVICLVCGELLYSNWCLWSHVAYNKSYIASVYVFACTYKEVTKERNSRQFLRSSLTLIATPLLFSVQPLLTGSKTVLDIIVHCTEKFN